MIDEKFLNTFELNIKESTNVSDLNIMLEELLEMICLARLGLWTEKQCIIPMLKDFEFAGIGVKESLAALPKGENYD